MISSDSIPVSPSNYMLRSIPATLLPSFGLPVHGGDKASRGTSGKIVHPRSYLCIPYMLFVAPRPHCLYHISGHFRHSFVRVAATEQWMNQKTSGGVSLFPRESGQKISLRYPVHPSDHSCTPLSPGQRSGEFKSRTFRENLSMCRK